MAADIGDHFWIAESTADGVPEELLGTPLAALAYAQVHATLAVAQELRRLADIIRDNADPWA